MSDQPDLDNRLFVEPEVRRDWFSKLENEAQRRHEAALITPRSTRDLGQYGWPRRKGC